MFAWDRRLSIWLAIFLFISLPGESIDVQNPEPEPLVEQLLNAKNAKTQQAILKANKDKLDKDLISALISAGNRLRLSGDYSKALSAFKLADSILGKDDDPVRKSAVLRGIGRLHLMRSDLDPAKNYFDTAFAMSDKSQDLAGKAEALRLLASIHEIHGQVAERMKCLQESLKIEESIQNKSGIALSLYSIATIHVDGDEPELGFEELNKSLKLAEQAGDKHTAAMSLNSLGIYYDYRGNYDVALEYYHRAENLNRASENLPSLANNLHNIATVYHTKGNYIAALQSHLESLRIREKFGNKRAIAISLKEIATLYADQGQFEIALEYLNQSYKALMTANDPVWSAFVLNNIGEVYSRSGETTKALSYFEKSLNELEKNNELTSIPDVLSSMGRIYASKKQFDKARECYRNALTILQKNTKIFVKTEILESSAWTEYEAGNYDQSLQQADEAIELAKSHEFPEFLWSALLCKAKVNQSLKQPEDARAALDESIQVLEGLRQQIAGGEEETERFLEMRTEPYAAMIEFLIGEKKEEDAFRYAERSKAKVLVDVMQKGRFDVSSAITPEEKAEENKLKENLYLLNVQFHDSVTSDNPDPSTLEALKKKLDKTRLEHDAFETKLYAEHPKLKVHRGEAETVDIEKARALLPDDRTAFLEYVVSKDNTFLFFLSRSELIVYKLPINENQLNQKVSIFRKQLSNRDSGFLSTAQQLYSSVFATIESQMKKIDQLIIIPDGILWELPFQALVSKNGKYLLESAAISYVPSITTFGEMHKIRQNVVSNSSILAFANPLLTKETSEKVEMVLRGGKLHPLLEAETEVKKLSELYGSDHISIYVGADAKESVLKQEIGKYDTIHLATHGILNETNPMYSNLLFSRSDNTDPEDGLLEAWEIMNMNLHASMVILSACETARGRIGAGEGVIGLNWAFFVAGCPTTIVSQWKVESSSTATLMFRLHQNLRTPGTSRTEALRNAALSVLKNPQYRHPFYWASFIIIGDPS